MTNANPTQIHATGEATGFIPAPGDKAKPITVIGTGRLGKSDSGKALRILFRGEVSLL